jgi:hypothetical protein
MKQVKVTVAPTPRTENSKTVALLLAGLLAIMVLLQLFSFEKFIPLLESYGLPGGHGTATLVAGVLVVTEVFALPFLLQMPMSRLMRIVSMVCGWLAVSLWLKLSLWANLTTNSIDNVGFFGTSVSLPIGWWAVLFTAALGVLVIWSAWGLWPVTGSAKHR